MNKRAVKDEDDLANIGAKQSIHIPKQPGSLNAFPKATNEYGVQLIRKLMMR